jgi:hypothetical protein
MSEGRPWYREPETFIALAALVVSVSAVVVGIYEASLQRAHDRAEVWPHVEVGTVTDLTDATIYLENTGVGPGIIESIVFTLDGKPRASWQDLVQGWLEKNAPTQYSHFTLLDHSLRAGEKVVVLDLPLKLLPTGFWDYIHRVGVIVCYRSVFDDHWTMSNAKLGGGTIQWMPVRRCTAQPAQSSF